MSGAAFWVYLIECENGSFYAGYARDPAARYAQHARGAGARYTRSFKPVRLAACWGVPTRSAALKLERLLKRCTHARKAALAQNPAALAPLARAELGLAEGALAPGDPALDA